MSIGSATRSEFTKYFTTSAWWVLALITAASLVFLAGGFAAAIGLAQSGALDDVPDAALLGAAAPSLVYGLAVNIGYIFPILLGVLLVAGEFRHQTLVPTFLATPKRTTVLFAKIVTGAVVGAGLGIIAVIATVGSAAAVFAATGQDPALTSNDNLAMMGRMILAFVLWTWVGLGLGSIVRNQVAAIVIALVFTQLVEPLLRTAAAFVPAIEPVARYLPSAASDTLTGSNFYVMLGAAGETQQWWVGAVILAVYAVVLTAIGAITTWRRDVD
ncbi:ABC transporter permease subunit [Microbacterium sp. NC79]|uniref:ABC transporter permease subunit n=1 Tax=Microbacterium sp. NC79 TaxID=2851009 RepID=UPI001C2C720D|nr:ABC transporter permease subunit [Microbacterium sp. NC79]MBV0895816.1 ABC transporter permease subunit [Microbacterium sp. NC79]